MWLHHLTNHFTFQGFGVGAMRARCGALNLTRRWGLGETVSHKQCIPDSSTHGPKKKPGENFFLSPENL